LWLESRAPALDARDLQAVNVFRIQSAMSPDLRVDHARPLDEPLLWVPDIVAGAMNAAVSGDDSFCVPLESLLTRYDIELH
jgi:hypothetical protein